MTYEVVVLDSARREMSRIPQSDLDRVIRRIDGLAGQPRSHGVQKLQGSADQYRIRQGRYRILYRIDDIAKRVIVYSVADRKDAYR